MSENRSGEKSLPQILADSSERNGLVCSECAGALGPATAGCGEDDAGSGLGTCQRCRAPLAARRLEELAKTPPALAIQKEGAAQTPTPPAHPKRLSCIPERYSQELDTPPGTYSLSADTSEFESPEDFSPSLASTTFSLNLPVGHGASPTPNGQIEGEARGGGESPLFSPDTNGPDPRSTIVEGDYRYVCADCWDFGGVVSDLIDHVRREHLQSAMKFGNTIIELKSEGYGVYPIIEDDELFWFHKYQGPWGCVRALQMVAPSSVADNLKFCIEVRFKDFECLTYESKVYCADDDINCMLAQIDHKLFKALLSPLRDDTELFCVRTYVVRT